MRGVDLASTMGQVGLDVSSVRSGEMGVGRRGNARAVDLASTMGQVDLDVSSTTGWTDESREASPDSPEHGEDSDEEDDDGGGVKL